jgi:Glycosyltransferase Family 4
MRVAFDGRPSTDVRGVGRYSRCLLAALREIAGEGVEIVETHRPRRVDVFHSPWMEGAILRSPCPMVVTLHDVDALTRLSERLRCGGVHLRLRHLALARATHVIVPTHAIADDAVTKLGLDHERVIVIPDVPDPAEHGTPSSPAWSWGDVARATWQVYERALSEPARAFIRPRAAIRP